MHDKARISFDIAGIVDVVVDAMSVEYQGGIPKQQHRIGIYGERNRRIFWCGCRLRGWAVRCWHLTIDDILPLGQTVLPIHGEIMVHSDKAKRAAAAVFENNIPNGRGFRAFLTGKKRAFNCYRPASPHASG